MNRFARSVIIQANLGKGISFQQNRTLFFGLFGRGKKVVGDADQQVGRRKFEMDVEATGQVPFNRDPIIPDVDAGSKEKPIIVPSGDALRTVGFEDPATHQLEWFNLHDGKLHFIPKLGLYFKLERIHVDDGHGHGSHDHGDKKQSAGHH